MERRVYFWVMVAAALCYATFIVELLLGYPLSPIHSYLSEYSALDQPTRNVFVFSDISSASLGIVATGFALWKRWGSTWVNVLLILAWIFVVIDVVFWPMQCAESLTNCNATDSGFIHMVTSSAVAGLHAIVALLLWRRYPLVTGAYVAMSVIVSVVAFTELPVGIPQRLQVLLESVVIVLAARATCVQRDSHDRPLAAKH